MIGILMLRRRASTFLDSPIPRQPLVNADRYFRLTGEERMIILRHMWPLTLVPPTSKAGYAVTCADKILQYSGNHGPV